MNNPKSDLVDVLAYVPDAVLDVRYATPRNFTGAALYPLPAVFLKRSTAQKLVQAAEKLRQKGFRLKLFDGYRPLSVQKKMWKHSPNRNYVADPAKGSSHNRGAAIDLALTALDGSPIEFSSDFDDFSERSRHGSGSAAAVKNAKLLRHAMEEAGFRALETEWWHYSDPDGRDWPLLDVPLDLVQ
jgi:D-alanyl-D-alanine dipeptidase